MLYKTCRLLVIRVSMDTPDSIVRDYREFSACEYLFVRPALSCERARLWRDMNSLHLLAILALIQGSFRRGKPTLGWVGSSFLHSLYLLLYLNMCTIAHSEQHWLDLLHPPIPSLDDTESKISKCKLVQFCMVNNNTSFAPFWTWARGTWI